jgi:hypothetical protein
MYKLTNRYLYYFTSCMILCIVISMIKLHDIMYCYKHDLIVIMSPMSLITFMYDKVCYNEIYML